MNRDRLAEARAAAQTNNDLEMSRVPSIQRNDNSNSFLNEISSIKTDIERFKVIIARVNTLNEQALNLISEQQQNEHNQQIDQVTGEARELMQKIKASLKKLAGLKLSDPSQENIRHNQYVTLKKQFMDHITTYQRVEQKHRQQIKSRMERQFRIVKPDATEEEVREVVDGDDNNAIFSQSVLQNARAGEAKRALKEVQDRHMDIQKIVKSIEELNALYHEMQYMVEQQDELVDVIENHVEVANNNIQEAHVQLEKATELAYSSRKKKWWIFAIIAIVLIIVLIIIIVQVILPLVNNGKAVSEATAKH